MEVYVACVGAETLLSGAAICCITFYDGVPRSLESILRKLNFEAIACNSIGAKHKILTEFTEFYSVKIALIEQVEGISLQRKIRDIVAQLIYTSSIETKFSTNNATIYVSNNIPTSSYDNQQYKKLSSKSKEIKSHTGLILAYIYAYEQWISYTRKVNILYPEYGFTKHMGRGNPAHYMKIFDIGLCEYHQTKAVLNRLIKFYCLEFNKYLNSDLLPYASYYHKLPNWWCRVDPAHDSLKSYLAPADADYLHDSINLTKAYHTERNFYKRLLLPTPRPFSKTFLKFLAENPFD